MFPEFTMLIELVFEAIFMDSAVFLKPVSSFLFFQIFRNPYLWFYAFLIQDFPLELECIDETKPETMSETKFFGVIVGQGLKWNKNTTYICIKAFQN